MQYRNPEFNGITFDIFSGKTGAHHNRELYMEEDGYIGRLKRGFYTLRVTIGPDVNAVVCRIDQQKNIVQVKPISPGVFELTVETSMSIQENCVTTKYPSNSMRAFVLGKDGVVTDIDFALVSQNGVGYGTGQETYQGGIRCYRRVAGEGAGEFACPDFERWTQLIEVLKKLTQNADLPPVSAWTPRPAITAAGLNPGTGRVKFFSLSQGWGAITTILPDGTEVDARVHRSNIHAGRDRIGYLFPGELVDYRELVSPNQTSQNRTTSFKYEAVGVQPL